MASKSMEENKRWIVTYTKHIRQKRKVYQDGVLEHHCSSNKILLYDDSGKLLDSRFLKKDDLVECGVTLAFESHLVDICDLDETHMPIKDHKLHDSGEKSTEKAKMYGRISTNSSLGNKRIELPTNRKVQNRPNPIPAAMRAFQILSALRRPPQQSLVPGKPLVDAACPQYLGLSHSDLPGIGCALKSDTVPETPSDVPKLVNPDCEVELWMVNHSPSSSILYGEGPCKSPITNLGVDSTVKNFLHLGTSGIVSEASDAANGSGGRTCIKEPHGSHAEEKSMQGSGGGGLIFKWKYCADESIMVLLHSDNMNPENAGFKGFHSLSASGLACAEAFPNINVDEKASELKTSPEEATIVDEYPSFDLGFELYYYKTSFGPSDHNR